MKHFHLCLSLLLFCASVSAQTIHSITVGPNVGIPINNQYNAKVSLGISGEYVYKFTPHFAGRLHSGYVRFKDKFSNNDFASIWSARIGVQVFLLKNKQVFIFADSGLSEYNFRFDNSTASSSTSFGLGFRQRIANNIFQFSGYLEGHEVNYSWINIRAAYCIGFGKER